jgi:hypothetical protein
VVQAIEDVFQGLYTVIELYCIAFGSNGAYYMSFIRNDGNLKYVDDVGVCCTTPFHFSSLVKLTLDSVHGNLPKTLLDFLGPTTKESYSPLLGTNVSRASITRSIPSTRVWLGPNGSFYAEDGQDDESEDLPLNLETFIDCTITQSDRLLHLTLGYNGGYFATFQNGEICYELINCARALDNGMDEILRVPGMLGRKKNPVKIEDIEVRFLTCVYYISPTLHFTEGDESLYPSRHLSRIVGSCFVKMERTSARCRSRGLRAATQVP